ncbi:MAG: hypothetical protein COU25_00655 [Candidatus Levybacteria bacterium CG10_big_fil_rev_8_21_14_0_10_35_13]|nr:MAG: hypothetical protein COU25_00655 [Candidatus Levybacteria bacterium CG10_big_fil_rev_8_21_14_0_10_35_13]
MKDRLKKYILYENQIWFIDLTGKDWIVEIVSPDGSRRPAIGKDGDFLDVLNEGMTTDTFEDIVKLKERLSSQ